MPRPTMPVYTNDESHKFSNLKELILFCKPYMAAMLIAIAFAICATVLILVGPDMLSRMTDAITAGLLTGIDLKEVEGIAFLLVALYGTSALLAYAQNFIMGTVTQKVARGLRKSISAKINKLPLKYFDKTTYGDVLSRVTNDVDTIAQTMNQSVGMIVTSLALFLGSLIMMIATNLTMTLAAVGATAVGFFLMITIIKGSQKHFNRQQESLGEINGHIEEIYSGHNVVRAYNGEDEAKRTFTGINDKLYDSAWKSQFFSGLMMPLMIFIGNIGYVSVCVIGGALAFGGNISFGVIVAFMIYVRLFSQPLSQMAQAATHLQSAAAASRRVFAFLEEEELADESAKTAGPETAKGDVEFSHVRFGYDPDKIIIHDFSAKIKAGQKIAIVGPTGAGKTTMVNLLMRFYETDGGEIRIDGVPTAEMTRENVHALFCMVLQDTWLFEGTIKENVVYSKKGVSDEEVVAACKAVGMHHFIRTLPKGYDTVLNETASLSAGQKQLLTIARAIVENAPLLILDEATSSVDTRTELLIQQAMDRLMAGRTSFVIAHRLSTIKNADLILVMDKGDIVESGTHDALLVKGGFYASLYRSQFEMPM